MVEVQENFSSLILNKKNYINNFDILYIVNKTFFV